VGLCDIQCKCAIHAHVPVQQAAFETVNSASSQSYPSIAIYATQPILHPIYTHHPFLMPHIFILAPWNGSQIPLTLSLILVTGLPVFLFFSPVLFRRISAFSRTSSICMFLTHIERSVPLMYCAMMTGCRRGRGLTEISICGLFFAKVGSEDFMNEFMPREEPHQLQ
jgi:hypothetical protein